MFSLRKSYTLILATYDVPHTGNSDSRECRIGNTSERTSFSSQRNKTLLNVQHPSMCSGEIDSWQLCYYTSNEAIRGGRNRYRASVGVWRIVDNAYTIVEGSLRNISLELSRNDDPEPALVCISESVMPIYIESGDVVGVTLPDEDPLPIVATGGNGAQLLDWSANQSVPIANLSLHLYAVVNRNGSSSSAATAIVVVLIVAIAIAATVIVLVLCYWKKQRHNLVLRGISDPATSLKAGTYTN